MAIVVIGGHSRSVGKTSVVAGLISALREYDWTAVKITQYGHGVCSANGAPCDCATGDHRWAISEEKDRGGESDTSRFLVAGAERALWVRTEQGRLAEAMPALRRRLEAARQCDSGIEQRVEVSASGLVSDRARPGYGRFQDFGAGISGSRRCGDSSRWIEGERHGKRVSLKPVAERPVFRITPPPYVTAEIVEFSFANVALRASDARSRE